MNNKKIATMFKAFCDENRLKILQLLQDGEIFRLTLTRQKSEDKIFENSHCICIRSSWKYKENRGCDSKRKWSWFL